MDRCPTCHAQMLFVGIAAKGEWSRWTECSVCGRFTQLTAEGGLRYTGVKGPTDEMFVTDSPRSKRR